MMQPTRRQVVAAVKDMHAGIFDWRLWSLLAWQDIKQRYRRSTLGPLWLTLSTAVQMFVMGTLGGFLFHTSYDRYLPFICAGFLFWGLMTSVINDSALVFITSVSHLTQIHRPLTTFLMQVIWRNIIIMGHNVIIYVIIAAWFGVSPNISILLWPVGFLLVVASVSWMGLVAGIVSARYRDIPMIIQSVFNILFWLTPLVYYPEQLGERRYIVEDNPFTHMLALLRDPLLGQTPSQADWLIVALLAVGGWTATFFFLARFRARIVYWL